ncbi:MAG: hypothetical protein RR382_04225 [Tannerellaceae bacterium]
MAMKHLLFIILSSMLIVSCGSKEKRVSIQCLEVINGLFVDKQDGKPFTGIIEKVNEDQKCQDGKLVCIILYNEEGHKKKEIVYDSDGKSITYEVIYDERGDSEIRRIE